jgi:hypothetical protein
MTLTQKRSLSFPVALGCMSLTGTWNASEMDNAREKRAIAAFEIAGASAGK